MAHVKTKNGCPAFDVPSKEIQNARSRFNLNPLMDADYQKFIDIDIDEAKKLLNNETGRRLVELIDYYQIKNDDDYFQLALCLASDFVENFNIFTKPTKVGRKKGRSIPTGFALLKAVEAIMIERQKGASDACHILANRAGPWKGKKESTLETRYYEAKKAFAWRKAATGIKI